MIRPRSLTALAAVLLAAAACSAPAPQAPEAPPPADAAQAAPDLPAGTYRLDKTHATLSFSVDHLGFSNYTAQFETFDAVLELDPADPAKASLSASVDVRSLRLPNPPPGFTQEILGPNWLDAGAHPTIAFVSTSVVPTGPREADVTGDLTLHGQTRPVTLKARFNGGYRGHPMDPNARIGFSAEGVFDRSDFAVAFGVPAPGSTLGVGDAVTVRIEAEFTGPAMAPDAP